jgi:hypothetical protein
VKAHAKKRASRRHLPTLGKFGTSNDSKKKKLVDFDDATHFFIKVENVYRFATICDETKPSHAHVTKQSYTLTSTAWPSDASNRLIRSVIWTMAFISVELSLDATFFANPPITVDFLDSAEAADTAACASDTTAAKSGGGTLLPMLPALELLLSRLLLPLLLFERGAPAPAPAAPPG